MKGTRTQYAWMHWRQVLTLFSGRADTRGRYAISAQMTSESLEMCVSNVLMRRSMCSSLHSWPLWLLW